MHPQGQASQHGARQASAAQPASQAEARNVLEIALHRLLTLVLPRPGESPTDAAHRRQQATDFFAMALESCKTLQDDMLTRRLLEFQPLIGGTASPPAGVDRLQRDLELLIVHILYMDHMDQSQRK